MLSVNDMKQRLNVKFAAYSAITFAIAIFIFRMSSAAGPESSSSSAFVVGLLTSGCVPGYDSFDVSTRVAVEEVLTVIVRKSAHMLEYACLGAFCAAALRQREILRRLREAEGEPGRTILKPSYKTMWCALALCVAYAATDETHQLFVPGRTGLATDVVIDGIGVFLAVLICTAFLRWWSERRLESVQGKNAEE